MDQATRIDIGLGHELSDLDGRVESSAMRQLLDLPLFQSERVRAGRVIRDVLVLVAFRP